MTFQANIVRAVAIELQNKARAVYQAILPIYRESGAWDLNHYPADMPTPYDVRVMIEEFNALSVQALNLSWVLEVLTAQPGDDLTSVIPPIYDLTNGLRLGPGLIKYEDDKLQYSNDDGITWHELGGVKDHTALTNIGTNTHAQLDTHLGDNAKHITDHGNLTNIGTNTHAQIDTHLADNAKHITDHVNLTSIGTNTHAQLDTHLANGAIHTPAFIGEIRRGIFTELPAGWKWCDGTYERPYLSLPASSLLSTNSHYDTNVTGWAASGGTLAWATGGFARATKTIANGILYIYQGLVSVIGRAYLLKVRFCVDGFYLLPNASLRAYSAANFTSDLPCLAGYNNVLPQSVNFQELTFCCIATTTVLRIAIQTDVLLGGYTEVDYFECWDLVNGSIEPQKYIIYEG